MLADEKKVGVAECCGGSAGSRCVDVGRALDVVLGMLSVVAMGGEQPVPSSPEVAVVGDGEKQVSSFAMVVLVQSRL